MHPMMRTGYVAMIDVLGWKGIWKRHGVDRVMQTVDRIRAGAADTDASTKALFSPKPELLDELEVKYANAELPTGVDREELARYIKQAKVEAAKTALIATESVFLSDTLIIGAWCPAYNDGTTDGHAAAQLHDPIASVWLCMSIAKIIRQCALADVPLCFRGSIARGDFLIDQNLILGPAIDEAAEIMNQADAAVVWFNPPDLLTLPYETVGYHFPYPIPLHGGRTVNAQAVNPFFGATDEEAQTMNDRILSSFSGTKSLAIEIKRQNTEAFLIRARAVCENVASVGSATGVSDPA